MCWNNLKLFGILFFWVQNDWKKILLVWHPRTPLRCFRSSIFRIDLGVPFFGNKLIGYLPLETVVWMAGQSHLNQKQTTARLSEAIKTPFIGPRSFYIRHCAFMAEILHQIRYQTLQKSGDVNLTGESNGINLLRGSGWIMTTCSRNNWNHHPCENIYPITDPWGWYIYLHENQKNNQI